TTGQVFFHGRDISGFAPHRRARLGLVRTFQMSGEFGKLTVLENLIAAVTSPGETVSGVILRRARWRSDLDAAIARAEDLLARFEMTAKTDTWAGDLSGGQKRLVEIMRALMATPRVLLLDEPLAGVAPRLPETITDHLMRLRRAGMTMLMVEHELGAVDRCCDSVIVMAQGRVLAEGSMRQIRANKEVIDAYLIG
ncbi:MAG: ABC transporter ATP-binding protein, partial [Solirubrobacteraceae bacterium]